MEQFIADFVAPLASRRGWSKFCEVGASHGLGTDRLLALPDVSITVIDPCLDLDLAEKHARESRVTVCKGLSLNILPTLNMVFDCILLDGDHNWYTVHEELRVIRQKGLLREGGVIFLDDVAWPYGRRDMYYQPEVIPGQFRLPYARKGIVRGRGDLSSETGINGDLCNALQEGGMRNGVLTAVEDFFREHQGEYRFFIAQRDTGLGAILRKGNLRSDFWFVRESVSNTAHNVLTWPRRFARSRWPWAYQFTRTLIGKV